MDDAGIVDLYWARSERAIRETERKFGGYCRTVAYNILSDSSDAEECVNDTWMKAWNSMPMDRPPRLAPYLGKMTRWLSLSRLREKNSLKRGGGELPLVLDELAEVLDSGENTEKTLELRELEQALRRLLGTLGRDERDVFLSRCWYMAPIAEIAEKYGLTESNVKTMLHRTRKKLLKQLKEEGLC
ncbi:MAG: sigma-70 family RNA polymerase sigma factor [Oscillospiraceae bacterium]|nr:sigma-70 family RNA polymerase sigma factor [Oscillospiraceae bacterium]